MTKPQPKTKTDDDALTSEEIRERLYEISSQALPITAVMRGRPDLGDDDELREVMHLTTKIRTRLYSLAGGKESAFFDRLARQVAS